MTTTPHATATSTRVKELTEDEVSYALQQAQFALLEQRDHTQARGVLILINGMENAGKGEAVKTLTEWMDARHIKTHATMGQHPSHYQPIWQRHTQHLPRHGEIAVYFGNWYADLIRYVFDSGDNLNHDKLSQMMADIEAFEQDLINNGTDIIKCWFEVDNKTLKKRLSDKKADLEQLYHLDWHKPKHLKRFTKFSHQLLDKQNSWQRFDGADSDISSFEFAKTILQHLTTINQNIAAAIQHAETATQNAKSHPINSTNIQPNQITPLENFELAAIPELLKSPSTKTLSKNDYKKQLAKKQVKLNKLLAKRGQRHLIFVFEGMDAAGKGGAIKRIIADLDPREYIIHPIAAPTQDELRHPYLWRFWTRLPHDELVDIDLGTLWKKHKKAYRYLTEHTHDSRLAIFDRSWYGRVLVERVEGFAKPHEWQRAYQEINRFEQDLTQSGGLVFKFWLAISNQEELKRFKAREQTPNKQYKITQEDWRNRNQWDAYVQAASDMLARTSSESCPWHIIATDDKYTARLMVIDRIIEQLTKQLDA